MNTRLYVGVGGINLSKREIFRSNSTPTQTTHGDKYRLSIGPFRTKAGAEYMKNNPFCPSVADAERKAAIKKLYNFKNNH